MLEHLVSVITHTSVHLVVICAGAIPKPDNKTRGLKQPPNTEEERAKEVRCTF